MCHTSGLSLLMGCLLNALKGTVWVTSFHGNDFNVVRGSWAQTLENYTVITTTWGWSVLSFSLLWTRVQNPVGGHSWNPWSIPCHKHGGGAHIREGQVSWMLQTC